MAAKELAPGRRGIFAGKVGEYRETKQLAHPDYELFDDDDEAARRSAQEYANLPIPIYPATSTIASWQIAKIDRIWCSMPWARSTIRFPTPLRARKGLVPARDALEKIHRPASDTDVYIAHETLRMHEALVLQTALLQQRAAVRALSATSASRAARRILSSGSTPRCRSHARPIKTTVGDRIARRPGR